MTASTRSMAPALLMALLLVPDPGTAVPTQSGPTGPYSQCLEVQDRGKAFQCCEEAFLMCLSTCPEGQAGPNSACGTFRHETVFMPCGQQTGGNAAARPPWPATTPRPRTGGQAIESPPTRKRPSLRPKPPTIKATPQDEVDRRAQRRPGRKTPPAPS